MPLVVPEQRLALADVQQNGSGKLELTRGWSDVKPHDDEREHAASHASNRPVPEQPPAAGRHQGQHAQERVRLDDEERAEGLVVDRAREAFDAAEAEPGQSDQRGTEVRDPPHRSEAYPATSIRTRHGKASMLEAGAHGASWPKYSALNGAVAR